MACVAPLRGVRYNIGKIIRWQDVITPPYDIISPQEKEQFRKRNEYNFVHLDLPQNMGSDTNSDGPYRDAADKFSKWLQEGILIQDTEPCIYYYELDYTLSSSANIHTRKGFISLLKLEELDKGCVYPHEKTFSRIRQDRLQLMRYCRAQLSPVFALFSDPTGDVASVLSGHVEKSPIITFEDVQGMRHRIWKVNNPEIIGRLKQFFESKEIFIADGHHRYETALAYRNERRSILGNAHDPRMPYEFCLVYLSAIESSGLTILPTHRMFTFFPVEYWKSFLGKAYEFFLSEEFPFNEEGFGLSQKALEKAGARSQCAFAFAHRDMGKIVVLYGHMEKISSFLKEHGVPSCFHDVDVVILDRLVFGELFGLSKDLLEDEQFIHFCHDMGEVLRSIMEGKYAAGFFVNPTRIEQVCKVALSRHTMPHKATYFYPKVLSGLVIYSMDENERIDV